MRRNLREKYVNFNADGSVTYSKHKKFQAVYYIDINHDIYYLSKYLKLKTKINVPFTEDSDYLFYPTYDRHLRIAILNDDGFIYLVNHSSYTVFDNAKIKNIREVVHIAPSIKCSFKCNKEFKMFAKETKNTNILVMSDSEGNGEKLIITDKTSSESSLNELIALYDTHIFKHIEEFTNVFNGEYDRHIYGLSITPSINILPSGSVSLAPKYIGLGLATAMKK